MTQNITSAKKNFEEKLIEDLSKVNVDNDNIEEKINIKNSDILSYILLLNATNNDSIDKSISLELKKTLRFNIFKFIKLSDFNIKEKYDLYKQKYISDDDIQKLNAILNVLKNSTAISNSLKNFFDSMDNYIPALKDRKSEITTKISKINKIKDSSINEITQIESEFFHYVKDNELLVVQNSDVINFINYLADEYINEIIERIYVGTFKSDVKELIDEIRKEEGGDIQRKDLIINKIISDAKIKAEVINKKKYYSDDKNIEILLSKNKSIFSYNLTNEIRNKFYDDNTATKQPIFFNKKNNSTEFFIIFLKKLYRVFIKDNIDQDTVKTNNFISYILYRVYYYYLNIVDNIKNFDEKYNSKILYKYNDRLETIINIRADNFVSYDNDSQGTSKITVLQKVLSNYCTFFDDLTTKIIKLLNSYDKDNIFNVIYPNDTEINKTQYFFSEFKKHIIDRILIAESEFGEDVSIDILSDCIYNYYNITFKYELYDSIYIYKDESLYILYKIYEHKYDIYYKKCYENESLLMKSFVTSSENLKNIFIEQKTKQDFKLNINILHGVALSQRPSSPSSRPSSRPSSSQSSRPSSRPSSALSALRRKNSSTNKVVRSDMLGDIVDRNLTEVFDTIKSDNTRSDTNLYSEKDSLLDIVEKNLIDIFDTFKSDKTIRDKVDSSLLDIVEINLIDIFDTFNTRTDSTESAIILPETYPLASQASSLDSTPRNRTEQESTINPQKYEKIINNLANNEKYIFAVDNFAHDIQVRYEVRYEVRYKVGYRMEEEAKATATDMNKDISLRSFNNYIIYIDNDKKFIKKFKINRKYNLKYILKIIYKKYDDIIIVSKPYDGSKNILYQYKNSNYINIIFIYKKTYGETEISQLENFEKIIDKKNQDKDDSTKLYYNKDYEIILKYFNDKKEAAKQQVEAASVAEITKQLKEGLATLSTGAMIVEKNTFEAPAAPEAAPLPTPEAAPTPAPAAAPAPAPEAVAEITKLFKEGLATLSTGAMIVEKKTFEAPAAPEAAAPTPEAAAPTPEAAAPTPEAVADTKASSVANYHRISNKIIKDIFDMLKTNNKALIISETKYSDNNKDEKKNINGVYTLHNDKDNETPLQYIYKSATSPNTIIGIGRYKLNSIVPTVPTYYISLTIKSDGNIVADNLKFDIYYFTSLLKDNTPYSFSDGNISFTINFEDNPNTETDDSLLDIVEGNLSNVFDTLDIKESKITINNPNTKTDDYLLDIVEGNLSNVFDTLNDNTDDDALKLIQFLINYHDINSNVSALNLIQFLINYRDINSNVSALNLIKFLINSHKN